MTQRRRGAGLPQPLPEHLITGERRPGAERLIGAETGLAAVMARARMVSRSTAPVLLFGETGTGKEIIARAIHEDSAFRNGPFRRVNCGAVAPELIDSELFGHEQGAFTGAVSRRKGWFEQADGGTLFLDEVGELAPAAQVRLLRVVQDGEVVRVGGERAIRVDVRIVAATHRDLPVDGRIPGASARTSTTACPCSRSSSRRCATGPTDIRAFADYFAERAADRFGLRPVPVSDDDVQLLVAYRWPGNVREMAAVMDRAVLIGQGRDAATSPPHSADGAAGDRRRPAAPARARSRPAVIEPLDVVMRRHIEAALREPTAASRARTAPPGSCASTPTRSAPACGSSRLTRAHSEPPCSNPVL